jgi:hypothetical protein
MEKENPPENPVYQFQLDSGFDQAFRWLPAHNPLPMA